VLFDGGGDFGAFRTRSGRLFAMRRELCSEENHQLEQLPFVSGRGIRLWGRLLA
jgi:hypothetical protein